MGTTKQSQLLCFFLSFSSSVFSLSLDLDLDLALEVFSFSPPENLIFLFPPKLTHTPYAFFSANSFMNAISASTPSLGTEL